MKLRKPDKSLKSITNQNRWCFFNKVNILEKKKKLADHRAQNSYMLIPKKKPLHIAQETKGLLLPKIPIRTAGSLEGICCKKGRMSSSTNHLSKYSKIFPKQTKEFTRT